MRLFSSRESNLFAFLVSYGIVEKFRSHRILDLMREPSGCFAHIPFMLTWSFLLCASCVRQCRVDSLSAIPSCLLCVMGLFKLGSIILFTDGSCSTLNGTLSFAFTELLFVIISPSCHVCVFPY